MEKEPFISRVRNRASKLAKAAVFAAALGAGEAMADTITGSEVSNEAVRHEASRENLGIFLEETVEPFIADQEQSESYLREGSDVHGLLSEEYSRGRDVLSTDDTIAVISDDYRKLKEYAEKTNVSQRFLDVLQQSKSSGEYSNRVATAVEKLQSINEKNKRAFDFETKIQQQMNREKAKKIKESFKGD